MTHRIVKLARTKAPGRDVWAHERRARDLGLELVLEVHAKDALSRAISELWRSKDARVGETLAGIYLLRADLVALGPQAAVSLTPYALFGVPLFVAWNPLGQVLTRNAFTSPSRDDLIALLSAFFDDVAHGRKHELHPAPAIGGERLAPLPKPAARAATVETVGETVTEAGTDDRAEATSAVAQLAAGLDAFLGNALELARSFLRQHDLRDDLSLHSLRQLDAWFDESASELQGTEPEGRFLAALGVYLGSVVVANAPAEWFVDSSQSSPIDALCVRVTNDGRDEVFQPVAIALGRLRDTEQGFFGHAVAMCRKL